MRILHSEGEKKGKKGTIADVFCGGLWLDGIEWIGLKVGTRFRRRL